MLPSLSAASPCGPEPGVFNGYSFMSPVFGSSRPSLFASCPVYHKELSGATAGSCGREFGVGTSNSRIVTFTSLVTGRAAQKTNNGKRKRKTNFLTITKCLRHLIIDSPLEKLQVASGLAIENLSSN